MDNKNETETELVELLRCIECNEYVERCDKCDDLFVAKQKIYCTDNGEHSCVDCASVEEF